MLLKLNPPHRGPHSRPTRCGRPEMIVLLGQLQGRKATARNEHSTARGGWGTMSSLPLSMQHLHTADPGSFPAARSQSSSSSSSSSSREQLGPRRPSSRRLQQTRLKYLVPAFPPQTPLKNKYPQRAAAKRWGCVAFGECPLLTKLVDRRAGQSRRKNSIVLNVGIISSSLIDNMVSRA